MLTANSQDNAKTPVGGKSQLQGKTAAAGAAVSKKKNKLEVEKEEDGQPSPKLVATHLSMPSMFLLE